MTIKEQFNGFESDAYRSKEEAIRGAINWMKELQSQLKEEHDRGIRGYRKELVDMSEVIHTLQTGYVKDVEELNSLTSSYSVTYEAV